jgi:hypothetical protein
MLLWRHRDVRQVLQKETCLTSVYTTVQTGHQSRFPSEENLRNYTGPAPYLDRVKRFNYVSNECKGRSSSLEQLISRD